jgi:hypothetical protein
MFAGLAGERQRFVNPRQGFFRVLSGLKLREKTLEHQGLEIVAIAKKVMVGRVERSATG